MNREQKRRAAVEIIEGNLDATIKELRDIIEQKAGVHMGLVSISFLRKSVILKPKDVPPPGLITVICAKCKDEIRVNQSDMKQKNHCNTCDPHSEIVGTKDTTMSERNYHGGLARGEY